MRITKTGFIIIGLFILLLILSYASVLGAIWSFIATSPWWTYLLVIGIAISGYMAYKHSKEDYEADLQFIEQEGNIYLERIEAERERRRNSQSNHVDAR